MKHRRLEVNHLQIMQLFQKEKLFTSKEMVPNIKRSIFYLVTEINYEKAEVHIQKFCGNQLRSKKYLVKLTDIYPALSSTLPSSFDKEEIDDDIPLFKSNEENSEINLENQSSSESSNESSLQEPLRRSARIRRPPDWLATSEMERA